MDVFLAALLHLNLAPKVLHLLLAPRIYAKILCTPLISNLRPCPLRVAALDLFCHPCQQGFQATETFLHEAIPRIT